MKKFNDNWNLNQEACKFIIKEFNLFWFFASNIGYFFTFQIVFIVYIYSQLYGTKTFVLFVRLTLDQKRDILHMILL